MASVLSSSDQSCIRPPGQVLSLPPQVSCARFPSLPLYPPRPQRYTAQLENPAPLSSAQVPPPCGCHGSPYPSPLWGTLVRPSYNLLTPPGHSSPPSRWRHESRLLLPQGQGPPSLARCLAVRPSSPAVLLLPPFAHPSPLYGSREIHGWTHSSEEGVTGAPYREVNSKVATAPKPPSRR